MQPEDQNGAYTDPNLSADIYVVLHDQNILELLTTLSIQLDKQALQNFNILDLHRTRVGP